MIAPRLVQHAVVAMSVVGFAGCSGTGKAQNASDPQPSSTTADQGIAVDENMRASLTVKPVSERDTASVLTLSGKVQFDEDRVARVLAPIAGQIVGVRVKVGDRVSVGETICSINSREAAAAVAEHMESRTDLDLAEKNSAMTHDLFEHEAASRIAVQQAETELAKAQARFARTSEALNVLGLAGEKNLPRFNGRVPIVSPIAGVIIERRVTEGQFVQADPAPMLTVANLETVWVMGDLFERDLRLVRDGQAAAITTTAYPDETFHGRVDYISDSIDPATRTAKVRIRVPNPGGRLKPEMFVTVSLQVTGRARVLVVPTTAVFSEGGRSYVYVEVDANRFRKRPVDIAHDEGTERRVLSGLQPGDRVVVDGVLLLRQEERQRLG